MASTNPIVALYNTVQTNGFGSTISTGYIPYVSTAGKQTYSNTLSTITISTLLGSNVSFPTLNTSNVAASTIVTSSMNISSISTSGAIIFPSGYIQNSSAIGYGQSYNQPSRALGTAYTNSTGRPIMLAVSLTGNSGSTTTFLARAYINGVQILVSYASASYNAPHAGTACTNIFLIVPAGSTYQINTEGIWGVNGSIQTWAELY